MIYTIYPVKDTTIYEDDARKQENFGLDEIIEISKFVSHSQVNGEKNSRIILNFNSSSLDSVYKNHSTDVSASYLQLYCAKEEEISRDYNLIIGRGEDFTNGTGKMLRNPAANDGANWLYKDATTTTAWRTGWPLPSSSEAGTTITEQYTTMSKSPFDVNNYTPDIYEQTGIVKHGNASHSGVYSFVIHRGPQETDGKHYGTLRYFGNESKTIFRPRLHVYTNEYTSSATITNHISASHMKITSEGPYVFEKDEKKRIYFNGHNTIKDTKSYYTTSKVSTRSYIAPAGTVAYQIVDAVSETVYHRYDKTYTKVSNDATGHYIDITANSFIPGREYYIDLKIINRQSVGSLEKYKDVHRFMLNSREII